MKPLVTWCCWTLAAAAAVFALSRIDPPTLVHKPLLVPGLVLLSLGLFIEARKQVRQQAAVTGEMHDTDARLKSRGD